LAGSRWCGCNGLYEVVCGLGEVVDLHGVDDWGSGSWFEGLAWCIWLGILRRVCEYCVHGGMLMVKAVKCAEGCK